MIATLQSGIQHVIDNGTKWEKSNQYGIIFIKPTNAFEMVKIIVDLEYDTHRIPYTTLIPEQCAVDSKLLQTKIDEFETFITGQLSKYNARGGEYSKMASNHENKIKNIAR